MEFDQNTMILIKERIWTCLQTVGHFVPASICYKTYFRYLLFELYDKENELRKPCFHYRLLERNSMKVPRDIPTDVEVFAVSSTGRYFALRYPMDPGTYQEIHEYLWHHGMDILSTLLALSEEKTPVIDGFLPEKISNGDLWWFLCC